MNKLTMLICSGAILSGAAALNAAQPQPLWPRDVEMASLPTYSGSDLELTVNANGTHWRLWSPEAEAARVLLYNTDRNTPPFNTLEMTKSDNGTWTASVAEQLYGRFYTFQIKHNGKWLDETPGIWAKATGTNGQRAAIIDFAATNPDGWVTDRGPGLKAINDAVIYEMHHRDFSVHPSSGIVNKGKFLALTEADTKSPQGRATGIDHLKELGVTHVHILPSYDYNSVDESNLPANKYNWGYDPQNYNVPEGSFATDPFHGEVRVKECRAMVAALHRAGLGVVMDVVYNHTYHGESNLERTVPGYWNRRWPNDMMTNGSGCGCDLASERPMVRKYVVESVLYWATAYHIDGFRFDLMALEDVDTMNAIRAALDSLPGGESILLYGEPWMGGGTNLEGGARPADKRALDALHERIGFFCDDTRDCIKGNVFDAANAGYVNGAPQHGYDVLHSISAWRSGAHGFWPKRAGQVVQYVSAHDNYTLWDKLAAVGRRGDYDCPDADLLAQNRMTAGIYLTCQGLLFMQAGEEWGRTKYGDHNSYKGPLATNRLDWTRAHRPEFAALTAFYRGMLAIRRAYPRLSGAAGEPEPFILALPGWLIGFVPENDGTATAGQLAVYYNPERTRQWASLPAGTWRKVSDGVHAGVTPFGPCFRDALELAPTSVTVLVAE